MGEVTIHINKDCDSHEDISQEDVNSTTYNTQDIIVYRNRTFPILFNPVRLFSLSNDALSGLSKHISKETIDRYLQQ